MLAEKTDNSEPEGGSPRGEGNQQKYILVQVALRLFHEKGYGHVKLSDISKAAGMSLKDVQNYFASPADVCPEVIAVLGHNQQAIFDQIGENGNPRQRLSLYLDTLVENADVVIARGCPMTNLYFDVRRDDDALGNLAAKLLQQRLNWITEQFVMITRVDTIADLPERLDGAIHGIIVLAQVTGNESLIRNQVNQLKSWIRSM